MAEAIGWGALPIGVSLRGLQGEIDKQLRKPLRKAAKESSETLQKGVGSGVDAAAERVSKANFRVKKSSEELSDAEAKRKIAADKAELASRQLAESEGKLAKAKKDGTTTAAQLEKAEQDVISKRAKSEQAMLTLEKAERGYAKASEESTNALKAQEKAQQDLEKATEGGADATKKFGDAASDADGKGQGLELSLTKIAAAGAAVVGAIGGATKAAYDIGASFDDAYDTIRVGTGASGEAFEDLQESMRNVARDSIGVGDDLGEIGTTLADLNTRLGVTGEPLEQLTSQFQQLKGMGMEADINAVTGAFQQYGVEVESMPDMMDTLFQISQATGRGMNELVTNLSKSGPALQEFGFGLEESAGLLGAMDKAGLDADKTMMSMTRALSEFAKEGKDPQEALWGTVESIDELAKAGDKSGAIDLANKIFGAKGGVGFVAAVESGQFAYEDFMDSIGASADTIDGLASGTASFSEMWDQVKLQALLALEPIATKVFEAMVPALEKAKTGVEKVIAALAAVADWVRKSRDWLEPLGVSLSVLAGGLAAVALQQKVMVAGGFLKWIGQTIKATKVWTAVTKAQEVIQRILNATLKANPMGAVVAAITAVVAGLTYFFAKTEKGQEILGKITNFIQTKVMPALSGFASMVRDAVAGAFEWLGGVISGTWKNKIKPTFDLLVKLGKVVADFMVKSVVTPVITHWQNLSNAVQQAWENIIKPTLDAFADGIRWLWENAVKPAVDAIKAGFELLGDGLVWVYENVIKRVFDGFVEAVRLAWEGIQVVFGLIKAGWESLGDALRWVYDNIIQPVWDAFGLGLTWLKDNVVTPVLDFIGRKWKEMSIVLDVVKTFVVDKVFGGLSDGLDAVKRGFEFTVDAIGRLWNGIKAMTAKPVQWVVDVVFNNGIRKAWNAVAGLTGLDKLDEIQVADLGNYASGGVLPGYTPGRDPYTFVEPSTGMRIGLGGGEAILRPEATRALGPQWVDSVNRAARSGGQQAVERTLTHSHFASGGIIDLGNFANGGFTNLAGGLSAVQQSMGQFVGRFFPGAFNLTSATRPGDPGFHGVGLATDWQAKDGQFQSQMPTPYSKALARAIYTNFRNSTELIHWPLDGWANLKNGAHLDYGPATNAGHGNHVHWAIRSPLRFDGDDIVLDDVSGISSDTFSWNPINMVKRLWDGAIEKIGQFGDADKHGLFGELPGAMAKALAESAWKFVSGKADNGGADDTGAYHGAVGAGVEQWRGMVEAVLRDKGFPETLADTVLRRMNQESGGNVRALNDWDVNAVNGTPSKGLMQVIDPTFAAHKDPGYDDIWNPEANLRASMNYAVSRYGSLPAAYNRPGGYANGGVLPGFTPGVDVHQFYSPTAGWLGLSGGESIMVPEWTAMQGGPAAVERMNRAARAGRSSSARGQAFADGGTFWGPIGTRQRGAVQGAVAALERLTQQLIETGSAGDFGAEFSAALQPIRQELQTIADAGTLEGVAARSAVSQGGQVAGMLGFKGVETVISSLLDAEKSLIASREGHASRLAEIRQREEELAALRQKLSDAEKVSVEDDEADAKKIAEAEKAVAKSREDSGKAAEKSAEKVEQSSEKAKDSQEKTAESAEKSADKVQSAQEKLDRAREDAEENRQKREEKKQQDIEKATGDITKAEADLAKARRESANALDMLIFDVDPSIYQGLMQVSDQINASIPGVVEQLSAIPGAGALAAKALPQVAGGVAQLAGLAGPAGVSVGVAIDALKTGITLFKQIGQAVGDFVGRIFDARMQAYQAMGGMFDAIRQLGQLTSDLRFEVVGLMADYEMALIKLTEAQRNQRIVAMQGIQAQLQAQLGLAEAEDALAESREADMQTAKLDYDDLTTATTNYRHVMVDANGAVIDVNAGVAQSNLAAAAAQQYKSQETMALEAERDAARLAVDIAMKQAAEDNLAAQWESTQAALDLRDVTRHLGQATKQLAMMSGGYAEQTKSAMVGKQISELMAEKAKLQGEKGKNWWRLGSWHLSGANRAASKRISQIEEQIAELQAMPEFAGFSKEQQASIDYVMANATRMGALGGAEHIETMLKSSAIGDAQRTLDMHQLKTELAEFDKQQEDLRAEIERKQLERDYMRESGAMGTEIQGLEMMREGYLAKAQMHRAKEDSNARQTLEKLSRTQLVHGAEIRNLSVAPEKTVQMPSDRRAFTADEVEEMLGELDVRVEKLERPQPTAAMVAASRR